MSLEEILNGSIKDLNDKIFAIDIKENDQIDFKFVHLKIKEFQV